ncbi:hypothetical protein F5X99DRAFT_43057 [Biscogniauxia marginata]|nr:hypothetical protein F5X99DRAFT_43057 [Biscogniauxia marginata]
MLSKSNLSIRRLISQRRSRDEYDDGGYFWNDEVVPRKITNRDGDKDPWLAKRRLNGKKRPPAPIIVRSPPSIVDLERPLPPLPDETPRSSTGSVCSCCRGRHVDSSCPYQLTGAKRSPLCSASSKGDRSAESLQLSSATSYGPDDFPSRQASPKSYAWSPHHTKHRAQSSGSTLGSTGALSLPPDNEARSSKEHLGRKGSFHEFTDNVRQLIQETDEAFKIVGSVLAEAKIPDISLNNPPRHSTFDLSPILASAPKTRTREIGPTSANYSLQSPTRNSSTPRVKRKRSKKTQSMKPYRKPGAAKLVAKGGSRWTLTENVSELLTGKIFHKIEADEMLTPSQLEAYKLRRMSQLQAQMQAQNSAENLENDTIETPTEPFHLQDLPSRIGSSGVGSSTETAAEDRPSTSSSEEAIRREWENDGFPPIEADSVPQQKIRKNNTFPATAPKTLQRQSPRRQKTALSIIPETATPVRDDKVFFSDNKRDDTKDSTKDSTKNNTEDLDYIYLQSPPCTLTVPGFRHGPIRLDKSDLMPDVKLGADDGLDWTAFQMAILGGAGDWFTDSDDTIRRREAEEAADIVGWWDSWSFHGTGALVTQEMVAAAAPSPTSTISGGDLSDVSYGEIESDNPYSAHHQWQHQRGEAGRFELGGRGVGAGEAAPPPFRKWTPDSEEKQVVQVDRESFISLPQSPMLDLKIIGGPDGDDMDVVPMGYNLGHDLGDFLKWEAEHAYAGDFYTAPPGMP